MQIFLSNIFRIRNLLINEDWSEPADTLNQIILGGVSQPLQLELLVGGGKVGKVATPLTATQSRPPTPPDWLEEAWMSPTADHPAGMRGVSAALGLFM